MFPGLNKHARPLKRVDQHPKSELAPGLVMEHRKHTSSPQQQEHEIDNTHTDGQTNFDRARSREGRLKKGNMETANACKSWHKQIDETHKKMFILSPPLHIKHNQK